MVFKGRSLDLTRLHEAFRVVTENTATTPGNAVIVTGRRRVGKSRLVQEFCDRSQQPYILFQATRGRNPAAERADFIAAITESDLPHDDLITGLTASDWNQALRTLALAVPDDTPSIVVFDEVSWLIAQDAEFEGALQTVWDRYLSAKPVFLLLIGSDVSAMRSLRAHDRPLFGRAAHVTVHPFNAADVQAATGLAAADAIDARLITGGFPEIVQSWRHGMTMEEFLDESLRNPLSPLLVSGELTLLSEFPQARQTRAIVEAIGHGERTFSAIAAAASTDSAVASGTLGPILKTLTEKDVIVVDQPLSTKLDAKNRRYDITDSYLRFWLAFLQRGLAQIDRGRSDVVNARIRQSWASWRDRAVEPLVREALHRLLPDADWPGTEAVGGWWNRQNKPAIDLVGTDRAPVAKTVDFVGAIKWCETGTFGRNEYQRLEGDALFVPGATASTPLVAVSRCGFDNALPLDAAWGPEELIAAWA